MLKNVSYQGTSRRGQGEVAYIVVGHDVFFSALTKVPSSINSAERIVKAIAEAEGISETDYQFHDVQTCQGYTSKRPGQYEIDTLVMNLADLPKGIGWKPYKDTPEEVLREFHHLIG